MNNTTQQVINNPEILSSKPNTNTMSCFSNANSMMTESLAKAVNQLVKLQLTKLVPVHKVAEFKRDDKDVIFKEMALFKIVGKKNIPPYRFQIFRDLVGVNFDNYLPKYQ